jgi:hypothetical protein
MTYNTEMLIDVTSMKVIANYMMYDGGIEGIIHVKDEELGRIGDLVEQGEKEEVAALIERGKIDYWWLQEQIKVPLGSAVDCIRLDPYYLIKDLKKPYR